MDNKREEDIEKYGVRGMTWRHRKRQELKQRITRELINIMSSLEGYAHHRKIGKLIMQEIRSRPGGMVALQAYERRAREEHKRRWGHYPKE